MRRLLFFFTARNTVDTACIFFAQLFYLSVHLKIGIPSRHQRYIPYVSSWYRQFTIEKGNLSAGTHAFVTFENIQEIARVIINGKDWRNPEKLQYTRTNAKNKFNAKSALLHCFPIFPDFCFNPI